MKYFVDGQVLVFVTNMHNLLKCVQVRSHLNHRPPYSKHCCVWSERLEIKLMNVMYRSKFWNPKTTWILTYLNPKFACISKCYISNFEWTSKLVILILKTKCVGNNFKMFVTAFATVVTNTHYPLPKASGTNTQKMPPSLGDIDRNSVTNIQVCDQL